MCVSKSEGHMSPFSAPMCEMSDTISLKMGVKFGTSEIVYHIFRNPLSAHISHKIH